MSKYFLILIIILISACSKSYIESDDDDTTTQAPLSVSSTYSSVDYTQMNFSYLSPEIIKQVEVRRELNEPPLTEYDGELVFLDTSYQTSFFDYQTKNKTYQINFPYFNKIKILINKI